ncbi:TetR family transcriptional regulator [Lysobacter sp. K5869]|uniref:TetR/AcrR family transcriptional regulator n=1 Tax=Lysobacter sp. K5869 TaxID=2820808 RepID=UPI001C05F964|nr:TetR/AcrR family transcriptional regulator [Lysobacter sp. K5869]QWP77117.1 TetR family transcriptional regulator [Lysobacter sp. K5869]
MFIAASLARVDRAADRAWRSPPVSNNMSDDSCLILVFGPAPAMARKPLTKPRKNASQDRSRATVDALVEATARILVKDGFDRASTNRIAEAAGVSVGSLYQYFPSKEALVAAVIDRHNDELTRTIRAAMAEVAGQPLEAAVRRLAVIAIQAHRIDPKLHRALTEQVPRTGRLENVELMNREAYGLFRAYLDAHREELRPVDLDMATFVCVHAIEAVTHNAVLYRPQLLAREGETALADEVTRLIVGYLR